MGDDIGNIFKSYVTQLALNIIICFNRTINDLRDHLIKKNWKLGVSNYVVWNIHFISPFSKILFIHTNVQFRIFLLFRIQSPKE